MLHSQAHGCGLVQQLVGNCPVAFLGRCSGAITWEWPRDFWMPESTGAPSSPGSPRRAASGTGDRPTPTPTARACRCGRARAVPCMVVKMPSSAGALPGSRPRRAGRGVPHARWERGNCERQQADEPVGLLHVAGDLGQVAVGGYADGAAQEFADVVLDGLLDPSRAMARAPGGSCSWPISGQHDSSDGGACARPGSSGQQRLAILVGIFSVDARGCLR